MPAIAIGQTDPWTINETVVPLTGAKSISAVLTSTNDLTNMIGQPQKAGLVLRCSDNVMAAYISWPEVLDQNGSSFIGQPQAMLLWRVDQAPIKVNFWSRDNAGVAVGHFDTKASMKWIGKLIGGKQLVVRMTARQTQDAIFDISGITPVATRVGALCGVTWTAKK